MNKGFEPPLSEPFLSLNLSVPTKESPFTPSGDTEKYRELLLGFLLCLAKPCQRSFPKIKHRNVIGTLHYYPSSQLHQTLRMNSGTLIAKRHHALSPDQLKRGFSLVTSNNFEGYQTRRVVKSSPRADFQNTIVVDLMVPSQDHKL